MSLGWDLGVKDELGNRSNSGEVWVVVRRGFVRLVECKVFEELGEISRGASSCSRFSFADGCE